MWRLNNKLMGKGYTVWQPVSFYGFVKYRWIMNFKNLDIFAFCDLIYRSSLYCAVGILKTLQKNFINRKPLTINDTSSNDQKPLTINFFNRRYYD